MVVAARTPRMARVRILNPPLSTDALMQRRQRTVLPHDGTHLSWQGSPFVFAGRSNLVPSQSANGARLRQSVAAHAPHPGRAPAVSPPNHTCQIEMRRGGAGDADDLQIDSRLHARRRSQGNPITRQRHDPGPSVPLLAVLYLAPVLAMNTPRDHPCVPRF